MLRRIFFQVSVIIFLCLLTKEVRGQGQLNPDWVIRDASSVPTGGSQAWGVDIDANGNICWGISRDVNGLFQFTDIFMQTRMPDSTLVTEDSIFGGNWVQMVYNLHLFGDHAYLAGRSFTGAGISDSDALLVDYDRVNRDTHFVWTWDRGFGYEEVDGIFRLKNDLYLTGWTKGDSSQMDFFIQKMDTLGNLDWRTIQTSPGGRDDRQDGHIVVDDSMVYLCGVWNGSPGLALDGRSMLLKYDRFTGILVDSILFGSQDPWINAEDALGMTSFGDHLYVTGYTNFRGFSNYDIFLGKYDKNLNEVWFTTWGGDSAEACRAIAMGPDGTLYLPVNTSSYGNYPKQTALVRYDSSGNYLGYDLWGGPGDDHALDIAYGGGSVYITGRTDSWHPAGKYEAFLLKVKVDSLQTQMAAGAAPVEWKVYPNPVHDRKNIQIEFPHSGEWEVELLDRRGRRVCGFYAEASRCEIATGDLPGGVYLLRVRNEEYCLSRKLIIQPRSP